MVRSIDYNSELYNERVYECLVKDETELIQDLKDTLMSSDVRTYLCANELNEDKRIFAVKFDKEILIFANPVYQERKDFGLIRELDFAVNKEFIIPRFKSVTICYQNESGEVKATKFNDDAAIVICQAMDCLDGIHAHDFGLEVLPEFDEATDEEREEVVKMYLNSLKDFDYALDKDLSENEETKAAWTNFKFNRAVVNGDVEIDKEFVPEQKLNRKQRRFFEKFARKAKGRNKKNES